MHRNRVGVFLLKKIILVYSLIPFYALVFMCVLLITMFGSHAVTVMSEATPLGGRVCIIIDPGHGGEDGGTTSCTGVLESTINLEISLRLNDLFHLLGYETKIVRTSDQSVSITGDTIAARKASDLKQRVKLVNETDNSLLISIHQNHFPEEKYRGTQVFYPKTEGSDKLGRALQTAFVNNLNPDSKRKAKPAQGVYLMDNVSRTGVLIECGFLSNPEEEALLRSTDYQQKICCVIVTTVADFIGS